MNKKVLEFLDRKDANRPVFETIINSSALFLFATGALWINDNHDLWGLVLMFFGACLEFFKYWGRKKEYW